MEWLAGAEKTIPEGMDNCSAFFSAAHEADMRETMRRTCVMQNINLTLEFNWISCHPSVSFFAGRKQSYRGTKAIRIEDHQELESCSKGLAKWTEIREKRPAAEKEKLDKVSAINFS